MAKQKKTNRLQKQAGKAKKRGKRLLILLAGLIVLWILTLVFAPAAQPHPPMSRIWSSPCIRRGNWWCTIQATPFSTMKSMNKHVGWPTT